MKTHIIGTGHTHFGKLGQSLEELIAEAAYVAAKHGVVGLTKVIALETAGQAITVNAICLGWTDTPILEPQINARMARLESTREEAVYDLVVEKQPTGKLVDPRQVAGLVEYLASDMAENMIGTAVPIDGAEPASSAYMLHS